MHYSKKQSEEIQKKEEKKNKSEILKLFIYQENFWNRKNKWKPISYCVYVGVSCF